MAQDFLKRVKQKEDLKTLAQDIIGDPSLIPVLTGVIHDDKSSMKFYCTKLLRFLSDKTPKTLYSFYDDIAVLLRHPASFVQWDALFIIANLAAVDSRNKFMDILPEYFGLLYRPQMITAANVVCNAVKIVFAYPQEESRITQLLLKIPGTVYTYKGEPSPECNRVLCGHLIQCFDGYFHISKHQEEILTFVKTQLSSPRKQVVKTARLFLTKHAV